MNEHANIILRTDSLCKYYGAGDNLVKAVDCINLEIKQGEFVSIVGKSGSGKSTLLHMLGALTIQPPAVSGWMVKIYLPLKKTVSPKSAAAKSVLFFSPTT